MIKLWEKYSVYFLKNLKWFLWLRQNGIMVNVYIEFNIENNIGAKNKRRKAKSSNYN